VEKLLICALYFLNLVFRHAFSYKSDTSIMKYENDICHLVADILPLV
jgi:hypothetical protein